MENNIERTAPIQPYTLTQLCDLYKVCHVTMRKWLYPFRGEMGHNGRTMFTIAQVKIIFIKLGVPNETNERN
jgi:hypothetical protein